MKRGILGTLVGIGLVMAAVALADQRGDYLAQRAAPVTAAPMASAGTELIVAPTTLGDKQVLTVIDPRQRVLSVYHIDLATGNIALKSVRNIQYDLRINNFNTEKPLPQEIQSQLDQK
jgi:hypothetical protein